MVLSLFVSLILLVVVLFVAERGGKENLEHVTDTSKLMPNRRVLRTLSAIFFFISLCRFLKETCTLEKSKNLHIHNNNISHFEIMEKTPL